MNDGPLDVDEELRRLRNMVERLTDNRDDPGTAGVHARLPKIPPGLSGGNALRLPLSDS